jgi:hypothetical protein
VPWAGHPADRSHGDLSQYLRDDHPDVYTVVKGDTLWDISGRFLERPWLWPEVWRVNPQIENPHLIYPGDRIALVWVDGQPQLTLERGDAGRTYRVSPSTPTARAQHPRDPAGVGHSGDPPGRHSGFLVQNRVVAPGMLDAAPYVVQGESERIVLGAGDRLYVRGQLPDSESFNIVRRARCTLTRRPTKCSAAKPPTSASARCVPGRRHRHHAREQHPRGSADRRSHPAHGRAPLGVDVLPSAPRADINGQIISVFGGVTQVGQFDVVVLNRGEREGLIPGNVLAIYKRGALARDRIANQTIRLPSERAGLLMVFRTFEKAVLRRWCWKPSGRWRSWTRRVIPDHRWAWCIAHGAPGL